MVDSRHRERNDVAHREHGVTARCLADERDRLPLSEWRSHDDRAPHLDVEVRHEDRVGHAAFAEALFVQRLDTHQRDG